MHQMDFTVNSGTGKTRYQVTLKIEGERASMSCDCIAGRGNRTCKHRLSLLQSDASDVEKSSHSVEELKVAIQPTVIGKALAQFENAEQLLERANGLHQDKKEQLARILNGSI